MKLHYLYNNLGHAKTIIMIHSFPAASVIFDEQLAFWNKHYNTLTFDLPGFGFSKPVKKFSISTFINKIRDLIDKLKIKADDTVFYGISFGGIIALEYSKRYHVPLLIFESTPFNSQMITTGEFKAIDILEQILIRTNWLDLFAKELQTNRVFQDILLILYDRVRPKAESSVSQDEIRFFMQHLDLKTVFAIVKYLADFNLYEDLQTSPSKKMFVYDRYDNTVPYSYFAEYVMKYGVKTITTEYHVHAPSTIYGKEIAQRLIIQVGKFI